MFKITKKSDQRLDLELSGKLSKEEMKKAWADFETALMQIENGRILYRIYNFHLPSLGAIAIELRHLSEVPKILRKIDRVAVMTDTEWLKKVSEWEGKVLPGMDIKAFGLDQILDAEEWLGKA